MLASTRSRLALEFIFTINRLIPIFHTIRKPNNTACISAFIEEQIVKRT